MENENTAKNDVLDFLATARKRFSKLKDNDSHNRTAARENLKFVFNIDNGQWDEKVKQERAEEDRPCLTSNKLRKFVAQVANRERDQRIAGNARPVDSKGDVERARIISGIIRQIEHASNAEKVYTDGGEHAIAASFGYWRIVAEEQDDSFDQELFIKGIKNQFNVYLDPDGMYGFIREKVHKDEFKHKYPDAKAEDFDNENYADWYDTDNVFIAEYFYKERVKTTIVQARHGLTGEVSIFEIGRKYNDKVVTKEALEKEDWVIEKEKSPKMFKVKWAKITATQRLKEGKWVGKEIPIIEVEGDWKNIDGKVYKRNLTIDAHDDQRMYNYWKTNITETVALAIKAPYLVTAAMIKGLKGFWDNAHKKLRPYLPFNPQGKFVPKREPAPQVPTGADRMLDITGRDIHDTLGLYSSFLGEKSNERSGVAIQARANRSDFGTFHFPDNFRRAILETVRQLIDLIPKIYDTDRVVRILGEEGPSKNPKEDLVRINFEDESGTRMNDISVGKYDVVEDVKIMSTRRQEQLNGMLEFSKGSPNLGLILAPRIAEAMDWPGHEDIKNDMEKYLPVLLGIKPADAEGLPGPESGDNGGLL